jgi:hypothetical protein
MNTSFRTIYADFLQHCREVRPFRPWGAFCKSSDFWKSPQDEEATLAALRKKYGEKKLIESRVASYGARAHGGQPPLFTQCNNELIINPILTMPFSRILPLRSSPQSKPFDLLTGDGTISGRLPVCATLHDHKVQKAIEKMGVLCLAFSMEDLMAFRSVGIPASLARGLEKITRKTLKELCSALGFGSTDDLAHLSNGSTEAPSKAASCSPMVASYAPPTVQPRLFLVGWALSQLSLYRRGEVDEVIRNLARVSDCLEIDLDDVFLWRPSPKDLRRISDCLSIGERRNVQRAILGSLRCSSGLATQADGDVDEPSSLLETRTRLQEALSRSSTSPGERRRRLRLHREAVDTAFVTPVLEQAVEEPDPKRRSHLAGLARINEVLFPAVELYLARRDKEVAKRGVEAWDHVSDVRDLMKMFDTLFKFTQESE